MVAWAIWKKDEGLEGERNPNVIKFAPSHTFTTKDWTQAHAWNTDKRKQIRFLPLLKVYVAVAPGARGDLNDARANVCVDTFTLCSWATYDEYTSMFYHISILRSDPTRPELYTCAHNAKEFTCIHSLGVAMMRRTLVALGTQKKKGTSTNGCSCMGTYGVWTSHSHTASSTRQQHPPWCPCWKSRSWPSCWVTMLHSSIPFMPIIMCE